MPASLVVDRAQEAGRATLMFRVMMLVGFCGCASIPADGRRSGACPELAVEVDRVIPTRRGGAEARSQSTRLWVDARDVPHVTWSSQWWRFTTMGRSHRKLHHAWLAGRHGEPYIHYPNPRRGRGTLMVWVLEGSQAEPRVVHSVRLRRHLRPQVELGPGGAIHVLLVDTYVSDFAPNRYVKLRCRSQGS